MKNHASSLRLILASSVAALLAAPSAHAVAVTWTGLTNGTWNTAGNWSPSGVPVLADDLTILGPGNVAGALTINFDGTTNPANSLNITNTAATSILSTTGGKNLTIGAGGITTGAGAVQIGANSANAVNIMLNAAQTWNVGAGGLTVTNAIIGTNTALTKTGAGNLTINSAINTFTGGLNANGGTIALNFANMGTPTNLIDSTNALAFGGGGALQIIGKAASTNAQTFNGVTVNAGGGSLLSTNNSATNIHNITLGALTTTAAGGSLLVGTSVAAGTAGLTITTTTNSGTAGIYGGRVVFFNGTANTGYNWATTASGSSPFTLSALSTYSTMVVGATSDALNARVAGAGITLTGAHTHNSLKLEGSSGTLALGANLLTLTSGGLLVTGTTATTISGTAGATRLTAGNGSGSYDLIVHQYNSGGLTISAVIGNNGANAVNLVKAGTGDLNLTGINTYGGSTYINAGRLSVVATNSVPSASTIVQSGTGQFFTNIASGTISNPFNISGTGFAEGDSQNNLSGAIRTGSGALGSTTLSNTITLAGNSRIGAFNGNAGAFTTTISGQITGGFGIDLYGFQSLANATQVFVLSNTANNYTGTTNIINSNYNTTNLAGVSTTLRLGASNVIPNGASAGNVVFAINGTNNNATVILDLNGFSETINGLTVNAGTFATRITNSVAGASVLTIGDNNTTSSFGGTITNSTGTLAITKIGTGTLTLSGTNSFTGNTLVSGGKITLGNALALQNSAYDTASVNGGLDVTGFATPTLGGLTGSVNLSNTLITGYSSISNLTLSPQTGITQTYSGDVGNGNGSMILTKTGAGTQVLSGTNTHTGGTNVNTGTLSFASGSLGTTGNITVNGGTLQWETGNTSDISSRLTLVTAGSASLNTNNQTVAFASGTNNVTSTLTKTGTGTLTMNGNNLHDGLTTVAGGGVLTLAGDNTGMTGGVTLDGTTASTRLNINSDTALGTGTFTISGGANGTIANSSGATRTLSTNNAQVWGQNFAVVATNNLDMGTGPVTLAATRIVSVTGAVFTVGGVISGAGGIQLGGGIGTMALTNTASTYTGTTVIGNNVAATFLRVTKLANLSQASSLGAPTTATNGVITIGNSSNSGTLELVGGTTQSVTDRQVRIGGNNNGSGNAAIINNNTDPLNSLVFTNPAFNLSNATTGSSRSLTLGGSNTGNNEIQGAIINNNNNVGVSVSGTGHWILSGTNTYDGGTTVSQSATLTISGDNSGRAAGVTASTAGTGATTPRLNVNSATALGLGTLNFGGGLATDTVRLDNTSAGLVNVSTNNVFTLNRDFTFIGTQSLNLGNMTTTLGGLTTGTERSIAVTANTLTFGGPIGQAAANLGVNKLGAGTLVFNSANTYSGNVSVNGGILLIGNASALGFGARQTTATGTTTVSNGFTLDLNGSATVNEPLILNGTGIGGNGALVNTNTGATAIIGNGIAGIQQSAATNGSGYSSDPTITISGTGSGATATATLGVTDLSFTAFNGGDKVYTVAPTVTISGGGGGAGATATAVLSGGATGTLTGFTITNAGSGFTTIPTITFGAGTFSSGTINGSATGNATEFTVSGVSMTAAGSGYTEAPTYTFDSGNATAGSATLSSVTLAADSSIGGSGNITIGSSIGETGGARALTKAGAGKLTLTGTNTYTGTTSVDAGTLLVNGSISGSATTINGGTLGGSGTVGALTVSSGTLAPGNSPGILNAGNTTFSGGTAAYEIFGTVAGNSANNYDQLNVGGTVNFTANTALTIDLGVFDPLDFTDTFTLIDSTGGVSLNSFGFTYLGNQLTEGEEFNVGSQFFTISYAANGGNDVVLSAVPEPGSALMLIGGLATLLGFRRRRA